MAVERPQGAKLALGQSLGELADRGGAVVSGELRGHRNGQDGGERVTPPARAAELRHGAKTLPQASKPSRGPRSRVAFTLPVRPIVEAAQLLACVAGQREELDPLVNAETVAFASRRWRLPTRGPHRAERARRRRRPHAGASRLRWHDRVLVPISVFLITYEAHVGGTPRPFRGALVSNPTFGTAFEPVWQPLSVPTGRFFLGGERTG